jgi:hypothetical protein
MGKTGLIKGQGGAGSVVNKKGFETAVSREKTAWKINLQFLKFKFDDERRRNYSYKGIINQNSFLKK